MKKKKVSSKGINKATYPGWTYTPSRRRKKVTVVELRKLWKKLFRELLKCNDYKAANDSTK